jgi:hypothetical protein
MPVSKNRDIATMLGKTETQNSANLALSVADGAGGGSLTVHDSIGALPLSTATEGNMAFVNSNSRMYVYNGNGWYSATIVNTTPTWADSIGGTNGEPAASYSIDDSATPLVVTVGATDPEGIPIRYLGTASDSADPLMQSIIVDSDVGTVTFTPNSSATVWSNVAAGLHNDSAGGVFTYTFKATDGINILSKDVTINYIGLAGGVVKPETQGTAWQNATVTMTDAYGDGGTFSTNYDTSAYQWNMTTHSNLFDGMLVQPKTMALPDGEFLAIYWFKGLSGNSNHRGAGGFRVYAADDTLLDYVALNSRNGDNASGVTTSGSNPGTKTTNGASAFGGLNNFYVAYRYSPTAGSKMWVKSNGTSPGTGANTWIHVTSNTSATAPAYLGGSINNRTATSGTVSIQMIDATSEFNNLTF